MNLDEFIKNAEELGVVTLETDHLKEIIGGIGGPVLRKYDVDALDIIEWNVRNEGCYSC